jgi:hypothetical protein
MKVESGLNALACQGIGSLVVPLVPQFVLVVTQPEAIVPTMAIAVPIDVERLPRPLSALFADLRTSWAS